MFKKILFIIALLCVPTLGNNVNANMTNAIPDEEAVKVIVGEASTQGLRGMICVAEVLRQRGTTKGFYGYRSNRQDETESTWQMASKAWKLSATSNYTHGADHFENVKAFGEPWWAKNCIKTYEYKDHVFYKEVKGV